MLFVVNSLATVLTVASVLTVEKDRKIETTKLWKKEKENKLIKVFLRKTNLRQIIL